MSDPKPKQIVESAIAANALSDLILSRTSYRYLPVGSPAPGDTDLLVLLSALYDEVEGLDRERVRLDYEDALSRVLETIEPAAYALLFEALRKARSRAPMNRAPMNIALGVLAEKLRRSVDRHREALSRDFSGAGRGWANGWLGELERLSNLSLELGGPSFIVQFRLSATSKA